MQLKNLLFRLFLSHRYVLYSHCHLISTHNLIYHSLIFRNTLKANMVRAVTTIIFCTLQKHTCAVPQKYIQPVNWISDWKVPTPLYIRHTLHGTALACRFHSWYPPCWWQNSDLLIIQFWLLWWRNKTHQLLCYKTA